MTVIVCASPSALKVSTEFGSRERVRVPAASRVREPHPTDGDYSAAVLILRLTFGTSSVLMSDE